jgi:hypothetical protein
MSAQKAKTDQTISQHILQQIQSGHVAMRPRWQFTLYAVLGTIWLIGIAIITIYLVNLVAFKLRLASADRPMHDMRANVDYFVGNFPWLAFILALVSFGLLIWLAHKHDFSYRLGRWVLVAVVLFSLAAGSALAYTNLNTHLETFGPMRGIYGESQQGSQDQRKQNTSNGSSSQKPSDTMQRRGPQN